MELLIHYCWKHRLFPLKEMITTDGQTVEVIDPGLHNHHAGPDFFNAKVKINGTLWVGNVEIHERSSDWYLHGHDHDPAYDNVILHVARVIDRDVKTAKGDYLPQLQMDIPPLVSEHYEQLLHEDQYPPCYRMIPDLTRLMVHSWMSALQTERLEQKTEAIYERVKRCEGSWEAGYFVTLARNYGFGVNGEAFEQWAYHIPLGSVAHHRDDLFQIEAIFLGQAGLLELQQIPEQYQKRPQNFPHIRLSQLAQLYYNQQAGLSQLLECKTIEQLQEVLKTKVTPYWETHYTFGSTSCKTQKSLSRASLNLLMINTAIPMLFAYGRHHSKDELCERAFDLLEQLKAENNYITRMWQQCGLPIESAGDSQALIQLKKEYCDRKDCLRCRFGYEYLKSPKIPVNPKENDS